MVDVVCMGNPLLDVVISVTEEDLVELSLQKSSMTLIDGAKSEEYLSYFEKKEHIKLLGGSAANTSQGVVQLGGKALYIGKIGTDANGLLYEKETLDQGISSSMVKADAPTGHSIIMITPDGERTMATHLGAATLLTMDDVKEDDFRQAAYLHITGYQLGDENTKDVVMQAVNCAKANGMKVSMDVANAFIVSHNKQLFIDFLSTFVDVVFANEEEAMAFGFDTPQKALEGLAKHVPLAVVKLGGDGSIIAEGSKRHNVAVCPVQVVDFNGAGDMYAAGFLYGLAKELPVVKAGNLASYAAAQVVAHQGARLDRSLVEETKKFFR